MTHSDVSGSVLLAGCHDGVHQYRVFIDDSGSAGARAVRAAMDRVSSEEPMLQAAALSDSEEGAAPFQARSYG